MGHGVSVHPILVLAGLLAGEEIAGVAGVFLSVSLIAAALIVACHVMDNRRSDVSSNGVRRPRLAPRDD